MYFPLTIFVLCIAIIRCVHAEIVSSLTACERQWTKSRREDAVITFIVPSLSRSTLPAALDSIMNQINPKWLILVIFDGLVNDNFYLNTTSNLPIYYKELPSRVINDGRIWFIHGPSNRQANCGALNRNHAIKFAPKRFSSACVPT
jgi:hypothetical protein